MAFVARESHQERTLAGSCKRPAMFVAHGNGGCCFELADWTRRPPRSSACTEATAGA
jgi:hypothetical protein